MKINIEKDFIRDNKCPSCHITEINKVLIYCIKCKLWYHNTTLPIIEKNISPYMIHWYWTNNPSEWLCYIIGKNINKKIPFIPFNITKERLEKLLLLL